MAIPFRREICVGEFVEEIGEHILYREPIITDIPLTEEEITDAKKREAEENLRVEELKKVPTLEQRIEAIEEALGLRNKT